MQQFIIFALDHTDKDAINRRLAVRPAHFERVSALKKEGNFIIGAAILDDNGKMIGSNMIVQFESEEDLQAYLKTEPYIIGNVWDKINIYPSKVAQVNG
jgi:uncharacterized protein